jgi:hypothetical protein
MPLRKRIQALPGNELLRDLPLELDAVGTLSGHGFHPLKAHLTCQITNLNLSGPRGALHSNVQGWSGYPSKLSVKADIPDGRPSANSAPNAASNVGPVLIREQS